jgi:hypothetical protein
LRIGIDFDNTIAGYDRVFRKAAIDMGLLPKGINGGRAEVRNAVRRHPDSERAWQRLQGQVYGKYMAGAEMIDGAARFLAACRERGETVLVISHKTEFGHQDPAKVNLRQAALAWMDRNGFFADNGFAIQRDNVHFEPTRADKIARIAALRCTCYIDDLEEVLLDDGFPKGVRRILLDSGASARAAAPVETFDSWDAIAEALFHA